MTNGVVIQLAYRDGIQSGSGIGLGIRSLFGFGLELPEFAVSIILNHFLRATTQLCANSQGLH